MYSFISIIAIVTLGCDELLLLCALWRCWVRLGEPSLMGGIGCCAHWWWLCPDSSWSETKQESRQSWNFQPAGRCTVWFSSQLATWLLGKHRPLEAEFAFGADGLPWQKSAREGTAPTRGASWRQPGSLGGTGLCWSVAWLRMREWRFLRKPCLASSFGKTLSKGWQPFPKKGTISDPLQCSWWGCVRGD